MSKTILFVSHQASRTGAPIVLLHLLRWLKEHASYNIVILLLEGGELEAEFRELGETLLWETKATTNIWKDRWRRVTNYADQHKRQVTTRLTELAPALVYANTVVSLEVAMHLKKQWQCTVISHVHELSTVIDAFIGEEQFTKLSSDVDCFIAASEAVAANLHKRHSVPQEKIQTIHEFVPAIDGSDFKLVRAQIRYELGIPPDAFVVAGAGTIDWRKAPDLFIQVAQHVTVLGAAAHFIWPGGNLQSEDGRRVRHDVAQAGVADRVHFLGAKTNPYDYLSAADVFLLTSREDPYPLVCLEAAALGIPVVCFADAGGMPEFVEQDCGIIVPYLRSDLMAKAVVQLYESPSLRQKFGNNAAKKIRERHTVEIAGEQIDSLLRKQVAGSN